MIDLDSTLREAVRLGASDVHMKVGSAVRVRLGGELLALEGAPALGSQDTEAALVDMAGADRAAEFDRTGELDFSFDLYGVARFRVNAFRQRGFTTIVCRIVGAVVPSLQELGTPGVVAEFARRKQGLVIVAGPTGSGKTNTLAALLRQVNEQLYRHIVTIEDPIEFVHEDGMSLINQREVGIDTPSFPDALRRVLRQDPDVLAIGEIRDETSVRTALRAAETGHLVLSTIHAPGAAASIHRILELFAPFEQPTIRSILAGTLVAVVAQRLVPRAGGGERVLACEVLVNTETVRRMILDPDKTEGIQGALAEGSFYGMQTLDQSLLQHYLAGSVSYEAALEQAQSPHDFELSVRTAVPDHDTSA